MQHYEGVRRAARRSAGSIKKLGLGGAVLAMSSLAAVAIAASAPTSEPIAAAADTVGGALPSAAGGAAAPAASDLAVMIAGYQRPTDIPSSAENPTTAEKARLGKMLFFDPRLSGSGAISCASCHNPSLGWQDGLARGVGDHGGVLGRHTPTILNAAWAEPLFWDGRADTLEQQAMGPMMAAAEMAGSPEKVMQTITTVAEYRDGLAKVFPGEKIGIENVAKVMAVFERGVVSGEAPFDRWIKGDEGAISPSAKRGFVVFNTKGNCASCHSSWRFTDDGFHDIGLPSDDLGRGKIVQGIVALDHAFKTPTLRNIAERGPFMHDGSLQTLEQVVDHYDHGFTQRPSVSDQVKPLNLTAGEKADLVAFMQALTSKDAPVDYPILPR